MEPPDCTRYNCKTVSIYCLMPPARAPYGSEPAVTVVYSVYTLLISRWLPMCLSRERHIAALRTTGTRSGEH